MKSSVSPWQSLNTRATVFTLAVFVLGIWVLSWYVGRLLQSDMERLLGEQQFQAVSFVASEVNGELNDRMVALDVVAKEISAVSMRQPAALQTILELHPVVQTMFNGGVFITDVDGMVVADLPLSSGRMGINYMDRDSISTSLKQGKAMVGRPVIGKKQGAPIFSIVVPIRDAAGSVMGTLAGTINLDKPNFLDKLTQSRYGKTGGYLLNAPQHGLIVTATDKTRTMQPIPPTGANKMLDRYIQGYEGFGVTVNSRGVEQLSAAKSIPVAGWFMLAVLPTAEAFAPIYDLQQRMLLATIILTLLTGALTWWVLKHQLSPLVATADAMAALAGSNQAAQPLVATRPDEIGQLVHGFNRVLTLWTQREAALVDSQQNLAITLNSIGDAVIATDAAGRITRMNPAAERLTAWPSVDALGRPLGDVFCVVNATTRKPVPDPVQWVMTHEQTVELSDPGVLLARDGQQYQIANSAAPIRNAAGDIVGVVLVFSDVTERYRIATELAAAQTHLQATLDAIPDLLFEVDVHGQVLSYHAHRNDLLAAPPGVFLGKNLAGIVPPAAAKVCMKAIQETAEKGWTAGATYSLPLPSGETWFELSGAAMPVDEGHDQRFILLARDITERKHTEEALRIAATAFDSQQSMIVTNAQRVILRVNKAFTAVTGYSAEEVVGQSPSILKSGRHDSAYYEAIDKALEREGSWAGEIWNRRKNGEVYPEWLSISAVKDGAGLTTHFVAIFTDISERLNAQAQIDSLAFYDPLTHLPNRRLLLDRLEQALHASTRHTRKSALLFVDLDNFKTLNDTLGHHQGDLLLTQVAQRLKACIRDGDTVARLGSDEFVVMLENLSEDNMEAATQAETVGEKVLSTFVADFMLDGGAHHSTASVGITLFDGERLESSEQPLKRSELAMFQAKAAGHNTWRFFDARMQAEVSARAALETDLREAVQLQQFLLHYQPQVVGAGRITGVEVLVRWQHPLRGMVSPAEFIPLAEESGLILPIGQWVLETACKQLKAWSLQPLLSQLTIAVNVSARQFKQSSFVDEVLATLARTGANPKRLKLELTESMLVDDVEGIIAKMSALKARGVSFSLDDFGTGYSSLAYLKRLPLDQLKIDQGFVRNIVTDPNDAAIARMVVALAESMGLSVIAEGVELQAQAEFLAHQGCHAYQGYFFSKPLPLSALEAFVLAG
jgi:diguanylate cyclase (GGDEF)-like protein/PAS domain S-box-containing protein